MPKSPEEALASMIANYEKNTGKPLDAWVALMRRENLAKHGEIVKRLKEQHEMGHGYANVVAMEVLKGGAAPATGEDLLKGATPRGRLEASGSFNTMVSHRVRVTSMKDIDPELVDWLRAAYDAA